MVYFFLIFLKKLISEQACRAVSVISHVQCCQKKGSHEFCFQVIHEPSPVIVNTVVLMPAGIF